MPTSATHIWRPSSARLIVLGGFDPVPRGVPQDASMPLAWPAKDPADVLDYQLDISQALAGDENDGIATLDVQITPAAQGDLILLSSVADSTRAVLWLGGGQAGTVYTLVLVIGTNSGRQISRAVQLPVLSLASVPTSAPALLTDTGSPLVDENGTPLTLGG